MSKHLFNLRIKENDFENVKFLQERGYNVSQLVRLFIQSKADKVRREALERESRGHEVRV